MLRLLLFMFSFSHQISPASQRLIWRPSGRTSSGWRNTAKKKAKTVRQTALLEDRWEKTSSQAWILCVCWMPTVSSDTIFFFKPVGLNRSPFSAHCCDLRGLFPHLTAVGHRHVWGRFEASFISPNLQWKWVWETRDRYFTPDLMNMDISWWVCPNYSWYSVLVLRQRSIHFFPPPPTCVCARPSTQLALLSQQHRKSHEKTTTSLWSVSAHVSRFLFLFFLFAALATLWTVNIHEEAACDPETAPVRGSRESPLLDSLSLSLQCKINARWPLIKQRRMKC